MTELIRRAKAFAHERHAGQTRKGNNQPFISHLDAVTNIIQTLTNDEEIIAAAWLHDVVEDTDTLLEEIYELFGDRVGRFVELESEDKRPKMNVRKSWQIRKEEQIEELRNTLDKDSDVFMIALSDKLANVIEMLEAKKIEGMSFLNNFNNSDPIAQYWYYKSFADVIAEKSKLAETKPYRKYVEVIDEIFN
ncbi:HD domain-containing protein [Carnobacterium sp. TMP28]|uniref:HD domain-containing protein n=1 Tax=Carnobacterium sp. TMP28 TaxID=3397060 RepID=UPI0039E05A97